MVTKEHRAMRREQMERWLASDGMTVEEWCRLNRMSTSTFYLWLNKFREEEPESKRRSDSSHTRITASRSAAHPSCGRPADSHE